MLTRLPVFDETECARVADAVREQRRFWTPRHDWLPSYTLGAAAYLDIPRHGHPVYVVRAVRANKILRRMADTLEAVRSALEGWLGAETVFTRRYALPGFHVFEHHPRLAELEPSTHFDLQAFRLDFPADDVVDPDRRFSFTLPVQMPTGGAGLYFWKDILHHETKDDDRATWDAKMEAAGAPTYAGYALGELAIHSGSHLHVIAADREMAPGESRMTLQGHGQRVGDVWQLYW